jgi:hypothetical protein
MRATFKMEGTHRPVVVLTPEHGTESILLAAFIRYDANVFHVAVERYEDGQIKEVTLLSDQG